MRYGCPERPLRVRDMDASRLRPGLWQGGVEAFEGCGIEIADVSTVVFLAPDAGVRISAPELITYPLEDAPSDLRHLPHLYSIACGLAERVQMGYRVLVLCRQGRNRSGLVSGLTLNVLGVPGRKAVARIRKARRDALSTQAFAKYLSSLP